MIDNRLSYRLKIFVLHLFVFSIFFENWKPFDVSFTIVKITGIVYLLLSLSDLKNFSLKQNKNIIMPLFVLWLWLLLRSMFNISGVNTVSWFNFTLLQNIILFWLFINDIIKRPEIVKTLIFSYILGSILLGILLTLGIGVNTDPFYQSNRITFFGANSNSIGNWCATGIVFILGLHVTNIKIKYLYKLTLLSAIPLLISVMLSTGSRGALLSLAIGLLILFSGFRSKLYVKAMYFVVGVFALNYMVEMIENSEIMFKRFALFMEKGDEDRLNIWGNALQIIYDYPIFGIGYTGYENEMNLRFGYYLDTHNIFLYFLVSGGIIALFIYLYFLKNIFSNILRNKVKNTILFPLSLFALYLFTVFKSGGIINDKSTWLLLGFVYGFYYYFSKLNAEKKLKKSTTNLENPLLHR